MIRFSYELLPAQVQLIYVPDDSVGLDVCVYQGGYGSGKTFSGALLGHLLSCQTMENRGLVAARTYPMVRDTTLVAYFEHLSNFGFVPGRDYVWKASEQKLVYVHSKSEVLFRHLDDPIKIKSLNLGWVHLEEMGELDESAFLMALSRLRLAGVRRYRLFGTTNPQPGGGWMAKYFQQGQCEALAGGQRVQYRRIIAPSTENRYLNPLYLENMKRQYSESYYRMNVLGQDAESTVGLVCPGFSIANLDESVVYRPQLKIYLSCDFNVDPMCWVLAHRVVLSGGQTQYEFFDELCIENTNIVQTAEEFARRYGHHQAGVIVTGDASGRQRSDASANPNDTKYRILMRVLSDAGMRNVHLDVPAANPHQDVRVETWNGLVCNQGGVRRVRIHPKACEMLVWNLETLRYVRGSNVIYEPSQRQIEQDATRRLKFTKHPFDAAFYLTYRYDPIRRD